ncbi:hypothetical protein ACQEV4_40235 [Streptomyces shenzhenensis]|uniref:hypothetical protein n=1 Tax=Streptomyces shenzhenensis TaxID=943815 RepID=UPI003D8FE443
MAKQHEEMPDEFRASKYDWASWMNGKVWELEHGEDFHTEPRIFRQQIGKRARNHGMKAEVHVKGNTVFCRFYEPDDTADEGE